jgi:putative acetyltransferase
MVPAFFFRAPENEDWPRLADLWVASWREAMPRIDFSARTQWFRQHMLSLEAAGAATICGFDGADRLIGFVTVDPATGYLDQLCVAAEAKGSGAAASLLNEARRIAPKELLLDVNQDNARAVRFYEREGFERVGEGVNPGSGLKTWRLRWLNGA